MNKTIIVKVELEEIGLYGMKITKFEKVESFPKNIEIINKDKGEGTVSNYDFMTSESGSEEENESLRYLVPVLRYSSINDENGDIVYLEFDLDSYAKFVFLTKEEKGAYISFE